MAGLVRRPRDVPRFGGKEPQPYKPIRRPLIAEVHMSGESCFERIPEVLMLAVLP